MNPNVIAAALLVTVGSSVAISIPAYHDLQHEVVEKKPHIPILKQDFQQTKEGYQFSYETGNGIHAQETGYLKHVGDKKHPAIVQQGKITYHDEHGKPITLTYIADENGFQPQGAHLPTPPPIPHEIKQSLQQHQTVISHQQEPEQLQHNVADVIYYDQDQYGHY